MLAAALSPAAIIAQAPEVPAAVAPDPDAIVGLWATEPEEDDGIAHVEIARDGDTYRGTIVWTDGKQRIDRHNPDPALREREIVGSTIFEEVRFAGGRVWKGGTIYDPRNGKAYSCKMTLVDPETLKIRGFFGISLFGRTTVWKRADTSRGP